MAGGQAVLALRAAIHFVRVLHLSVEVNSYLTSLDLNLFALAHIVGGLGDYVRVLGVQHVVHVVREVITADGNF